MDSPVKNLLENQGIRFQNEEILPANPMEESIGTVLSNERIE
jgi:hypothetical protein